MPELKIIQENLSIFDKLELPPDARTEYENGEFEAIFPKNAETKTYVFSKYTFHDSTVDIPDNSMVIGTENGSLLTLVPEGSYQ
jgi:hypothetical protein